MQSVAQTSTPKCKSLILNHYNNALSESPLHRPSHHVVQIQRPSNPNFVRASQRSLKRCERDIWPRTGSVSCGSAHSQPVNLLFLIIIFIFIFYFFPTCIMFCQQLQQRKRESPIRSRHQFSSAAEHGVRIDRKCL